ncbi:MAG: hypothetical protein WDN00_03245 [Limisphaerales bacterium]
MILSGGRSRTVVELELSEGKNREVRRLFESQNITVKRLQRIQIGKIKLGELKLGKWRTLTAAEIKLYFHDYEDELLVDFRSDDRGKCGGANELAAAHSGAVEYAADGDCCTRCHRAGR